MCHTKHKNVFFFIVQSFLEISKFHILLFKNKKKLHKSVFIENSGVARLTLTREFFYFLYHIWYIYIVRDSNLVNGPGRRFSAILATSKSAQMAPFRMDIDVNPPFRLCSRIEVTCNYNILEVCIPSHKSGRAIWPKVRSSLLTLQSD